MPNGLQNRRSPLVAVFMVTYNHELFVSSAIDSVLSQKTTFDFQLFIGEDGSKDSTGALCQQFADQFSDKIKLFRREKNLGVFENANLLFEACLASGAKYIAMLEGDDCWISDDKLQKQIDYLELHEDCAGSYHNTDFLYPNGERKPMFKKLPESMILDDVIGKYSPFHTTSFVFRSQHFCRPTWFKEIHSVDLAMFIWHAQFGYFKGFNETWSLYRIHDSGLTAGKDHNELYHQKRLMLYRMLMGKITQPFLPKLGNLIQYHNVEKGTLRIEKLKSVLFFNTREGVQLQKLKMLIDVEVLPFYFTDGRYNGYFSSFKLTAIKWVNAVKLRWQYRMYWTEIKAVVFLSRKDAEEFASIFPTLNLPYFIIEETKTLPQNSNEQIFLFKQEGDENDVIRLSKDINQALLNR